MNTYSVVIPVYNQFERLDIVLHHFSNLKQVDEFEIVIVDDGSCDKLCKYTAKDLKKIYNITNLEIIHQENQGRSIARNQGVLISQGDYIVFCDGDRIPNKYMLTYYQKATMKYDIIVGGVLDCFMPIKKLYYATDFEMEKMSRYTEYYKSVSDNLFDGKQETKSKWAWLGFLVGNSCVKKEIILQIGGFSDEFQDWGFEHFEMAYRMQKEGFSISNIRDIKNYHIVHGRTDKFYYKKIWGSIELLNNKYGIDKNKLDRFFFSTDINKKYNFKLLEK